MTRPHLSVVLAVLASAAVAQPGRPFVPPPPPPPPPRPPDFGNQMRQMDQIRNQQNQFNAQRQQMDQMRTQVQQQMWNQQQQGQMKMREEADHLRRMTSGSSGSFDGGGLVPFDLPAKKRRIPLPTEVVVSQVGARSEGDKIGLRVGDVLLSYNDTPLTRYWDLGDMHSKLPRDAAPATLTVRRGDDTLTFELKPGSLGVWLSDR